MAKYACAVSVVRSTFVPSSTGLRRRMFWEAAGLLKRSCYVSTAVDYYLVSSVHSNRQSKHASLEVHCRSGFHTVGENSYLPASPSPPLSPPFRSPPLKAVGPPPEFFRILHCCR
jgi:hypothetical protein